MQVVIFIGLPASGKSTFYKERFADTHVRINRDMLKTKNRETRLFDFCLSTEQPCVIDNTNVRRAEREPFIQKAREENMDVLGYFFQSRIAECYERNLKRTENSRVPDVAIYAKSNEMELPGKQEGFDELYFVKILETGFDVQPWIAEPLTDH